MIGHIRSSFTGIPRAIWILSLVSLINRTGTMVVAFMTLYFIQYLHFSIINAGYASACFGAGGILGIYIGGILTDKIGYYRVQLFSLIAGGIMFLVALSAKSFYSACVAMFILALVSEAFRPANSVAVLFHSSEAVRTRSYSLLRVGVNMAIGLAFLVGGILISYGWQWLFWVDSITCFGAAIIVFFLLNDNSGRQTALEKTQTQEISLSAYRDKDFLFFSFLTLIGAVVFMQLVWTVPVFFKISYGWTEAQIGLVIAFNCALVMVIEMPLIFKIENKKNKLWFVRLGLVCYMIAFAALMLPINFMILAALIHIVVISFGEIFVMPFSSNWATTQAGLSRQGQYMALYNMSFSACNVISPILGTQIIDRFGFNYLWLILVVLSFLAWLGFNFLEKKTIKANVGEVLKPYRR